MPVNLAQTLCYCWKLHVENFSSSEVLNDLPYLLEVVALRVKLIAGAILPIAFRVWNFFLWLRTLIHTLYCVNLRPPLPQFPFEEDLTENHSSYINKWYLIF